MPSGVFASSMTEYTITPLILSTMYGLHCLYGLPISKNVSGSKTNYLLQCAKFQWQCGMLMISEKHSRTQLSLKQGTLTIPYLLQAPYCSLLIGVGLQVFVLHNWTHGIFLSLSFLLYYLALAVIHEEALQRCLDGVVQYFQCCRVSCWTCK